MAVTQNIIVDGNVIRAEAGANLLQACLSAKLDLPYFCWHPAMGSVGACRQCAVKIFRNPADSTGQIVMACMTPVAPGLRVSITDPETAAFRERVVEFVLTNHPHDCPVCEVGGECHLQDMTALTGHAARRTRFAKRTHLNQDLGPFIKHEMNRCIGCYRCVRFYQDYAGGKDFGVFGANRNVYFGRAADGALESNFAGNLVEVCPTGVFVDKPFAEKFRRKWDMRSTPSICPHCAVGCNITLNEREGKFRRVVNRFNATLNGYFLCDRGRFGTGFLASPQRLRTSRNAAGPLSHAAAQAELTEVLRRDNVIGIGSPRASLEANFLLRALVGPDNFYAALSDDESEFLQTAVAIMRRVPIATLAQADTADAVLILGADPAAIAPRLALALRQAARRVPGDVLAAREIPSWHAAAVASAGTPPTIPFVIATTSPTALDADASATIRLDGQDIINLAVSIADGTHPLAQPLAQAQAPVIVAGGNAATVTAAANIVISLQNPNARLIILLPESNSAGLGLLQSQPLSAAPPKHHVIVLEANPHLPGAASLTVLDHIQTSATAAADLAIAVGSFAESDGTFINLEGRAQRFHKAIFAPDDPPQSWQLLRNAGIAAGRLGPDDFATHASTIATIAASLPEFASIKNLWPEPGPQTPTLPARYSGRTAAHADADVREPAPPAHPDSPLGATMEGAPPTTIAPMVWSPGWNSNQAINKATPEAAELFLFSPQPTTEIFQIPPYREAPPASPEVLSSLSPAIIARRALP
jgi:NADH-quinone oxidoreductase subunit G